MDRPDGAAQVRAASQHALASRQHALVSRQALVSQRALASQARSAVPLVRARSVRDRALRLDGTAATQEDPIEGDSPEEDREAQPHLSRRAAVVRA